MPAGIEDNYVDELFLKGLVHKNSFPALHINELIRGTSEILLVCNSVVTLICSFYVLKNHDKSTNSDIDASTKIVLSITAAVFLLAYVAHCANQKNFTLSQVVVEARSFAFLTGILLFLTPLLQNLVV